MQFAAQLFGMGQGAAIKNRVAFAPGCNQPRLGQHLEVVAHAGLAGGENLRQLQHTKRIVGQRAQHIESQRIASSLAQGGELVAIVMAD